MHLRSKPALFLTALMAVFLSVTSLWADDWTLTGSAVRVKTVVMVDVNVYKIDHYMKTLPATKSKQAVIEADIGKKFVWTMKRDVDQEKIVNALKDAFAMNGYTDGGNIGQFTGAFKDLKEKSHVTIVYDADKKSTTITVDGGGSATIGGVDFMKAAWSIWFGKIDQKDMGDKLMSKIP